MTIEQYNEARQRLEASGAPAQSRRHHSCFGEDGRLMVFDIWDSQEDYDALARHLFPVLQELGITSARLPDIMPVDNFTQ
jgi:hypothetical protein